MTVVPEEARQNLGRDIVYAVTARGDGLPADVRLALTALAGVARTLVVLLPATSGEAMRAQAKALGGIVVVADADTFSRRWYAKALAELVDRVGGRPVRVALTGDVVIGPVGRLADFIGRMDAGEIDAWDGVQNADHVRESFDSQGFPAVDRPFAWFDVSASIARSAAWYDFWDQGESLRDRDRAALLSALAAAGARTAYAFPASVIGSADPALFDAVPLLEAGWPFVDKAVFQSYPPFLDRKAILGRDIAEAMISRGYPAEALWAGLARTTSPKTLNTNASMLEVLHDEVDAYDEAAPLRTVAVAHMSDPEGADAVFGGIAHLPGTVDVVVTTSSGFAASRLERLMEDWANGRPGAVEVRVTPTSRGRDMADLFVGCRDLILPDRYDLLVKLHARRSDRKTVNRLRYFRRYQLENLVGTPAHARNVVAMFQREPGLGLVFPPTMHIGYAMMGRAWAGLRGYALRMLARDKIDVPLDEISPLAPFGGMWIARTAALRPLAEHGWSLADYGHRGAGRYGDLAKLQERVVVSFAASRGFHVRTVLTAEHAAISHTALDYKTDELFSTTRGYPVEQIQLMQRAGAAGHGGPVALMRMYVNLNHPHLSAVLRPLYRVAFAGLRFVSSIKRLLGRLVHVVRRHDEDR
ncbi:lipopolysaccharide biosynthesis protein [Microbacterium telephonicum]|uniref:Lipopolysaccharide biosynthesis protein n=2 Tax=Microbacterium telephonicum TaxID=1714841 RepID=A0A498C4R0_9MICO|nr:lipopolysaccharide biosynthesis protein [Microbacterium telephonicum]